jgi:hypothetical protein
MELYCRRPEKKYLVHTTDWYEFDDLYQHEKQGGVMVRHRLCMVQAD